MGAWHSHTLNHTAYAPNYQTILNRVNIEVTVIDEAGATMNQISFSPVGDCAIILDFGPDISLEMNKKILGMKSLIEHNAFPGFMEIVPAYTTLTVFYDPTVIGPPFPYESVERLLRRVIDLPITDMKNKVNIIEIPVCYDQQFAWDLTEVALHNDLSTKQVVELHVSPKEIRCVFSRIFPGVSIPWRDG